MNKRLRKTFLFGLWLTALIGLSVNARAQISITPSNLTYTQNFNILSASGTSNAWADNSTLPGWYSNRVVYLAGTGMSNAGGLYSFGTDATDRALGSVASGSASPQYGVVFINNTGAPISAIQVAYTGEQWRNGGNTNAQKLTFSYATGSGLTLASAGTNVAALDFTSPVTSPASNTAPAALNGNESTNQVKLSATITLAAPLADGQQILFKWSDTNDAGNDHGLSVDDLTVVFGGTASSTPGLTIGNVSVPEGNSGTTTATFSVSLSAPAPAGGVTFDIATADGTAQAGSDYVTRSLTAQTIPAGSSTYTFDVTINGDVVTEPDETFFVNVTNVTGATLADGQGVGTITNDDASGSPYTPIGTARGQVGQTVTLAGRVTVSRQFGGRLFYIQDPTGGIAVFSGSGSAPAYGSQVQLGDSVQLSGPVAVFSGYTEINGVTGFTVVTGVPNRIPTPKVVTIDQLAANQGQLVTVQGATVGGSGNALAGNTNYPFTVGAQSSVVRINANSELVGGTKPTTAVNLTGIAERFVSGATTPGTNGLQLQPRIFPDVPGSEVVAPPADDQFCGGGGTTPLSQDQTFDMATWNVEFFGADGGTLVCPNGTYTYPDNGPANETLQAQNVKTVLQRLNADVVVVEEVSDAAKLSEVVSTSLGGYALSCSNRFSYYFQDECQQQVDNGEVFGPNALAQKVCVIYKTSTITPVPAETRPLLEGKYAYPNANNWSSGRLPYLFVADATINGVTKRLHIVGIHAKSGSATADYNRRKQDILDLKAELDANYPNANVIIAGDYNDEITSSIASGRESTYQPFDQDAANYTILTKPLDQTCQTFQSGSFLDHITISNELLPAYIANTTTVVLPGIPNYNNTTSDHNPVFARFDLSKLTPVVGRPLKLITPTYNCQTGAITFRTEGGDGSPVEFFGLGITRTWTTEPSQTIDAEKRSDPNSGTVITLKARQNGNEVTLDFDFGAYCRSQGGNLPPTVNLTLPSQTGTVGQFFSYKVPDGTFSDPESQALTYSAVNLPPGLKVTPPDLRLISGTPTQAGSYTALVKATDAQGAESSTPLVITIQSANTGGTDGLSVAQPIPNQTGVIGQPFTFTIPAGTFSGPVASVDVSDLARGLAYFSDVRTIRGTVEQPDQRYITVTAIDGQGNRAQTGFLLTFANANPGGNSGLAVAQPISDQTGAVGQFFSFAIPTGTFSGPVAAVDVSDLPRGLFYHSDTRTFDGTVSQPDSRYVTVTATDGQGNQVQTTFRLTFTTGTSSNTGTSGGSTGGGNPDGLAVAQPIADQTGMVGQLFTFTIPAGTFSGSVTAVDVSDLARGLAYFSDVRTIRGTVEQPDSRTLTVTAIDGKGGKAQTRFVLRFVSPNGRRAAASVQEPVTKLSATVLPNPVDETFTVRVRGAQGQTVRFLLTDAGGQFIANTSVDVAMSEHRERLHLGQRPTGLYLLRVSTAHQAVTLKVVKQ